MSQNLYHHLAFLPATEAWEMPRGLEALALALIASGKLRVNADHERNFVRYHDVTFSARELTDAALANATKQRIARHVAPAAGPRAIEDVWAYLRGELKKARGISPEKEQKVARVLVQSTHPSVMALALKTGTEIFVSYSHNVADLMPVHEWQNLGTNSGLQATDSSGAAVYVSCGGDPFFEGSHKHYVTDGFPALARMVVIAGQELGHFADLRRASDGHVIGRYSTDIPAARAAREADMRCVRDLAAAYDDAGLRFLYRAEQGVAFYDKRWRFSPPWIFYQLWRLMAWGLLQLRLKPRVPRRFTLFPRLRLGEAISAYLSDMQYNLAPDAAVYRHPDPAVEEAIATIEAVARVPQQVHKWGFSAVQVAWPGLTEFYYGTVLAAAQTIAPISEDADKLNVLQKLNAALRRAARPKPGYYP